MTLPNLVVLIQNFGMFSGCVAILVAIATLQPVFAFAGFAAMSPILLPFAVVEILGVGPRRLFAGDDRGAK